MNEIIGYKIPHFRDLKEMLLKVCERQPDDLAFHYFDKDKKVSVTYRETKEDAIALASYFKGLGLSDSKIALYAENSYEWIITYFAAIISDNAIVPLDKELKPEEAARLFKSCGAETLVYSAKKAKLAELLQEDLKHSLSLDNFRDAVKKGETQLSETDITGITLDLEKPCVYIFTSGTTGNPKCAMLCQRNIMSDMIYSIESLKFPSGTVCVLPLNHTFGMMACILCQFYCGSPVFINGGLKYILRDINEAKPGHISVVPLFVESFYKSIWKNAEKSGKADLLKKMIKVSNGLRKVGIDLRRKFFKSVIDAFGGKLEMIITGGAPIPNELISGFDDLGIQVVNGFGITECSPIVSLSLIKGNKPGSIGKPIRNVEMKVINKNEDGEGELCVKGDIVMLGYYNNPEANAQVFKDGWFLTGDVGRIDEDGFVFITGRKKNIIILDNGKNVYPEELEYLIGRIDGVTEVLVYAEDGRITAEIYAEDMSQKDSISNAVKNDLNPTIAQYKQIHKIKFREGEFEKTTTKKIKR